MGQGAEGRGQGAEGMEHGGRKILDVGTGTGLIALMLAQRFASAQITAIELNEDGCADALFNFQQSPWKERLTLLCTNFNAYQETQEAKFDWIVSNPPFFKQSLRPADPATAAARHDVDLTFEQLIAGARKLLNHNGRLAVILPAEAMDHFRETARLAGFYLRRKTTVLPKSGKPPKRVLLDFSLSPGYPETDELVILQEGNKYSKEFVVLTQDFYLNSPLE
jgi:tRNA1Val (adenine37-N6)-methyltransferase